MEGGLRITGNQSLERVVSHQKCGRRPGKGETNSQEHFANKEGAAY